MPYALIAQKSPYLRQFAKKKKIKEIEKREILKEIVKDYTKITSNNKLRSEAMQRETLITDSDIRVFQNTKLNTPEKVSTMRKKLGGDFTSSDQRESYGSIVRGHRNPIANKSTFRYEGHSFEVDETISNHNTSAAHPRVNSIIETNASLSNIRKKKVLHPKDLMRASVEESQDGYRNSFSRQSKMIMNYKSSEIDRNSLASACDGYHKMKIPVKRNPLFKRRSGFMPIACTMRSKNLKKSHRISTSIGRKRQTLNGPLLAKNITPAKINIHGHKLHNGSMGNMAMLFK